MRLLKPALAAVSPIEEGAVTIDRLVTGLPVNLYFQQLQDFEEQIRSLQDAEVRALCGSRSVARRASVGAVKFFPQPFGSLLDLVLDDHGQVARRDIAKGRTLVVDIGYHTVDLLATKKLDIVSRLSKSTNYGLASAYEALVRSSTSPCGRLTSWSRRGLCQMSIAFCTTWPRTSAGRWRA